MISNNDEHRAVTWLERKIVLTRLILSVEELVNNIEAVLMHVRICSHSMRLRVELLCHGENSMVVVK